MSPSNVFGDDSPKYPVDASSSDVSDQQKKLLDEITSEGHLYHSLQAFSQAEEFKLISASVYGNKEGEDFILVTVDQLPTKTVRGWTKKPLGEDSQWLYTDIIFKFVVEGEPVKEI